MPAKKPHKEPVKKSTQPNHEKTIHLSVREAELLRKSMGAKTPDEALAKAVELATRKAK